MNEQHVQQAHRSATGNGGDDARQHLRSAVTMLAGAVVGLVIGILSGLALVPRVRLVEVVGVLAGGIGCGASLVSAVNQFRQARSAARAARDRRNP